jgi:hypothetical protein
MGNEVPTRSMAIYCLFTLFFEVFVADGLAGWMSARNQEGERMKPKINVVRLWLDKPEKEKRMVVIGTILISAAQIAAMWNAVLWNMCMMRNTDGGAVYSQCPGDQMCVPT